MNGCLRLRAGVRAGRTVLLESQGTYPLQVVRPQAGPASSSLSLVLLLLSGGLLDGDTVEIDVHVESGARLALRTQAATQIHAGRACQRVSVTVGQGAWFSYLPHAVVPHAAADYHGRTEIQMQPDAHVLVSETLAPGRTLFGEQFAYCQVRLDLDVSIGLETIARERVVLKPDPLVRAAQFGPATHTAGIYQLGPGEPVVDAATEDVALGCTALAHGGWHLRALANRAVALDQCLDRLSADWWATSPPPDSYELHNSERRSLDDLPVGSSTQRH